ncbi:MAG: hypothetical protein ACR2IH_13865 [Pyrinomonadaceae bacterium]
MDEHFENSTSSLAPQESLLPVTVLTSVLCVIMLSGSGIEFAAGNLILAALFLICFFGVLVFAYQNVSRFRKLSAARSESRIDWKAAMPEVQRQNLNLEVLELSRILETGTEQLSDLQSAYIVAEDLALRQIQQEEMVPLLRHIIVCGSPFNAVLVKEDVLICAEVSFVVSPELRQEKIDAMLRKVEQVRWKLSQLEVKMRPRLMMVLITQLSPDDDARFRGSMTKQRFASTPVDIDIRFLDFEALQAVYITDGNRD